ncbi:MAG: hypothetical protein KIT84_21180 [Labilithrix sp.]|nr:hypothetical protein [Labilithrix sp.]MCW5813556.1 hypothetical protein [Labilithrix sp.]
MSHDTKDDDLFARTWKTVVVLVGACIVFVGGLSATAVFVTSRAVAPASRSTSDESEAKTPAPAATTTAKKPVSI